MILLKNRKKLMFYRRVKVCKHKGKQLIFVQFFSDQFFPNHSLSGIERRRTYFGIRFARTYGFGSFALRKRQKLQIVLKFLHVATNFSPKIHDSVLLFRSLLKSFYIYYGFPWKNLWFFPCVRILEDQYGERVDISFDNFRFSIASFLRKHLLHFFYQGFN